MTSTSVATVELADNNDAQRVGKFMCVVPPKVRTTRAMPENLFSVNFRPSLIVRSRRRATRGPTDANDGRTRLPTLTLTFSLHLPRSSHRSSHRPCPSLARVFSASSPQTLRVNSYGVASRAEPHTALDDALSALEFHPTSSTATSDGGGVAISVGPAIQAFTDNEIIVSFCGHLTNVDYLAWRLFSAEGRAGDALSKCRHKSPLEAASALVGGRCYEAELVCHMYKAFGTKALPKLRGQFSFVCFDARSVRVFAARDPSGTYPLLYGRDETGAVVVANFESAERMFETKPTNDLQTSHFQKLKPVPAGCFIYGHRGISPQRFAKDEASAKKLASVTSDAVADALRGLRVGRRSLDGRKSLDAGRRRSLDGGDGGVASSPPATAEHAWSRRGGGKSRLPWRKESAPLDASAKPWSTGDLSLSTAEDHGETEPDLSASQGAALAGLDVDEAHDALSDAARCAEALEPGTAREHARAETVAVKAAVAALRRVASGANMKGMVRMGSTNALSALGMARTETADGEGADGVPALAGLAAAGKKTPRSSGEERARRVSGNSDGNASDLSSEGGNMSIHRVPSRSGAISSMVKVASFGNLGGLQHVGSLNDLRHAAKEKKITEDGEEGPAGDAEADAEDAWADVSLLVISNSVANAERG